MDRLHISTMNRNVDQVRRYLDEGDNPNVNCDREWWSPRWANSNGWAPLHLAATNGYIEIVRELLTHGADVNFQMSSGETSISLATLNEKIDVIRELLMYGADPTIPNDMGRTAFDEAYDEAVREELRSFYDREDVKDPGCD